MKHWKKIVLVISALLFGVILFSGLKKSSQPADINVIGTSTPITLEGTLFKDTPVGISGNYYLTNLSGNVIKLETYENLDSFEGTLVRVQGVLQPQMSANDPQTIKITQLEILSTQ